MVRCHVLPLRTHDSNQRIGLVSLVQVQRRIVLAYVIAHAVVAHVLIVVRVPVELHSILIAISD